MHSIILAFYSKNVVFYKKLFKIRVKGKEQRIFIFGFCRYSSFGENVEIFVYFSKKILVC